MYNYPIDFVVPWVDSSDPVWKEQFLQHRKDAGIYTDISENRYRDWDLFKYWFRGVEKYAPWINKVHLITNGQHPEWLNLDHPKLNLVHHKDYMPAEFLPTFSSHPIELNIHRIEGLSEHFVYFNDDIFIKAATSKEMFFKNGLPCDSGVMQALSGTGFSKILMNGIAITNKNFSKTNTLRKYPLKWFNPKYGKQVFRSFLLIPWKQFTGFYDYHLPNAYLKSTFQEVWQNEYATLTETSLRKFRHDLDVNQYVFRYWQLADNKFTAISKYKLGDTCLVGVDPLNLALDYINSNKKPLVCLNDHDPKDLEIIIEELKKAFDCKFPSKSSFEN